MSQFCQSPTHKASLVTSIIHQTFVLLEAHSAGATKIFSRKLQIDILLLPSIPRTEKGKNSFEGEKDGRLLGFAYLKV